MRKILLSLGCVFVLVGCATAHDTCSERHGVGGVDYNSCMARAARQRELDDEANARLSKQMAGVVEESGDRCNSRCKGRYCRACD